MNQASAMFVSVLGGLFVVGIAGLSLPGLGGYVLLIIFAVTAFALYAACQLRLPS